MTIKDALEAMGRAAGSALSTTAAVINTIAEQNREIEEMAGMLMRLTPGLELTQAKLVARTLIASAEVTWK